MKEEEFENAMKEKMFRAEAMYELMDKLTDELFKRNPDDKKLASMHYRNKLLSAVADFVKTENLDALIEIRNFADQLFDIMKDISEED